MKIQKIQLGIVLWILAINFKAAHQVSGCFVPSHGCFVATCSQFVLKFELVHTQSTDPLIHLLETHDKPEPEPDTMWFLNQDLEVIYKGKLKVRIFNSEGQKSFNLN